MRILFVVNPIAGGGRALKAARFIGAALKNVKGIDADIVLTREAGHAQELAEEGARRGLSRVVAVGGDGTLNETVNGLIAAGRGEASTTPLPSVGIVPCGTGNDFARGMGLFKGADAALRTCLGESDAPIDVGLINGRAFINVAGFGFDAKVAELVTERYQGKKSTLPYLLTALRLLPRYKPTKLSLTVDGEEIEARALLGAVGNATTYGGGMKICPNAAADDGLLDICLVGDVTMAETVVNLIRVFRGTHLSHPKCSYMRARQVKVSGDGIAVHADGQLMGSLPATFSILPGALRLATGEAQAGSEGSTPNLANSSASRAQ